MTSTDQEIFSKDNTRIGNWADTKRKTGVFVIEFRRNPGKWVGLMIEGEPQVFDAREDALKARRALYGKPVYR